EQERAARAAIADVYRQGLSGLAGLMFVEMPKGTRDSRHYFVVRIDNERSKITRDQVYERMRAFNVFARRYFYPLCSNFPFYRTLPSSNPQNLPHANRASEEVLCLPLYGALGIDAAQRICDIVRHIMGGERV